MYTPKPKKLPSGSWNIRLRLGGESISITEPTERACAKKAQLIKAEYLAGKREQKRTAGEQTLGQAIDAYINARRNVLSPATVGGYEAIRRSRFLAYADRRIDQINWQQMVNHEATICSGKTLKNAWALAASALRDLGVAVPKVSLPQVIPNEHPYLHADQIPAFLEALRDDPVELAALLGLHSLRRSEIFGLTWADVDLDKKVLHIRGAVVQDGKGGVVRKQENKNAASRRDVPILIPRLLELLEQTRKEDRHGPLISCYINSVWDGVNRVCRKANLPEIGTHGLRHTFVSLAYHLQIPERETMRLGGYSDPQTMHRIYTHIAEADVSKAASAMSSFYSG